MRMAPRQAASERHNRKAHVRPRPARRGAAVAAGFLLLFATLPLAAADSVEVTMDQAKLVRVPGGTETLVIGNPAIADVTLQRGGIMVITGRSAGRTNLIALDNSGAIISESMVSVIAPTLGRVVVQRGLDRSTYDCAPLCQPTVAIGDDDKHFSRVIDQATKREAMAGGPNAARDSKDSKK